MFKFIHKLLHLVGKCKHEFIEYSREEAKYKQKVYTKITYRCYKCDYDRYEIHLNGEKVK